MDDENGGLSEEEVAEQITSLVSKLKEGKDADKCSIIREINDICFKARDRAKSAIPTLVAYLSDDDEDIGEAALYGLSWCGEISIEALIECLFSGNPRVRERACHALGNIGDAAALARDAVRPMLKDEIQAVRLRAAWALGLMRDTSQRTLAALFAMAGSSDAKERSSAFHALMNVSERLVDIEPLRANQQMIVDALKDENEATRQWACYLIGSLQLGIAQHTELLMKHLAVEDSYEVRRAAIRQLRDLASKADLTEYMTLMSSIIRRGDRDAEDMCDVLASLGTDARSSIPTLINVLRSDDGRLVVAAAKALWKIDRRISESLPALERIFSDHDGLVCDAVCEIGPAAAPLAPKLIGALQTDDWDLQWAAADALGAIASSDPKTLDALATALGHPSPLVSSAAANAFAKVGAPAVPELAAILQIDGDPRGEFAADALGRMGHRAASAADILRRNLSSSNFALAAWCAIGLAKALGDPAAVPLLIQLLDRHDRHDLQQQAAVALGVIGPPAHSATDALEAIARGGNEDVRAAATTALSAIAAKSN